MNDIVKGKPRLSDADKQDILRQYDEGASLRTLAERYKCTRQNIHRIVVSSGHYVANLAARRFKTDHMEEYLSLVTKGVTPEIAAAMFGLSKTAFDALMTGDEAFRSQTDYARYTDIAAAEIVVSKAAQDDPKIALERLRTMKETRDIWKQQTSREQVPIININMSWDRETVVDVGPILEHVNGDEDS